MDQNLNKPNNPIKDPTPGDAMSQDRVSTSGDLLSRILTPGGLMSRECQPTASTSRNNAHEGENEGRKNRRPDSFPGSAKRRLRNLLAQGMDYARTRELCQQPKAFSQGTKTDPTKTTEPNKEAGIKRSQKRNRSEEISPNVNPKKTAKLGTTKLTFKEVTSAIRIGIKDENKILSDTELTLLQSSILDMIDGESVGGKDGPYLLGCSHRDGWLCITCGDEHSHKWMTDRISSLKPWEGAKLSIMLEKDFPKPYIGVIWVPGPLKDPKLVLGRIKFQNRSLDCTRWRLLNSTRGENGQHITFSMVQSSYESLKEREFKICSAFGLIPVRVRTPKAPTTGITPMDLADPEGLSGPSSAPLVNQQLDLGHTATPSALPITTPSLSGNADIFDPQQPGPSSMAQAPTRAPATASSTGGMAQVLARAPAVVPRLWDGQKRVSGATIGSTNSLLGRPGSGRAPSAHQQTGAPKTQRGAMRRGRGRGISKDLNVIRPHSKAPDRTKP